MSNAVSDMSLPAINPCCVLLIDSLQIGFSRFASIFMKILANRLNPICNESISSTQQGFIAGRLISDTALDIISVLKNQSDQTKQHWLLFLDQQKAFDRINHEFIKTVLEKMNFEKKFVNII